MNNLKVLEHNDIRVLTTEQLAEFYGCTTHNITKNFNLNKERFNEGIHYFVLEGEALQTFRLQVTNSDLQISPKTRRIYDAKYGMVNTYHTDILQEIFRGDAI